MEMFGHIHNLAKPVEYRETVFEVGDPSAQLPDPMVKHAFFTTQNEYRFLIDRPIPKIQKAIIVDLDTDTSSMFGAPIEL
jgi:hypothetical protein